MSLAPLLLPLYNSLVKYDFEKFVISLDFTRLLAKLDLLNVQPDPIKHTVSDWLLSTEEVDGEATLLLYIEQLEANNKAGFTRNISNLIAGFLSWTKGYVEVEQIIDDLKLLKATAQDENIIRTAFEKYNRNYLIKVNLLRMMVYSTIESYPNDDGTFYKLIQQIKPTPIANIVPEFLFQIENLAACRQFLQGQGGYKARRAFVADAFKPALDLLESTPSFQPQVSFDLQHVRETWDKALKRVDHDPKGAITAGRSLLESVLKHAAEVKQLEMPASTEMPKMYKMVAKVMNMSPSKESDTAINQFLSGAVAMVDGLAGIRNSLGDAHGATASGARPSPRHAELVVNLSGALSNFLMRSLAEKHQTQNETPS